MLGERRPCRGRVPAVKPVRVFRWVRLAGNGSRSRVLLRESVASTATIMAPRRLASIGGKSRERRVMWAVQLSATLGRGRPSSRISKRPA